MSDPSVVSGSSLPTAAPAAARQRWRLVVARRADAPEQPQRDVAEAWTTALEAAGLPLAWTEGARAKPKIAFGAPLPVGMAAEGELIDVVMTDRWPVWRVREAITGRLPVGWRLVDLHDVWLAGPALAGRVAAADYRVTLALSAGAGDLAAGAAAGAAALIEAPRLPRSRAKGSGTVEYDLRPLLIDVRVTDPGPPVVLLTRTRFHPELGSGRPEEVVAAIGDRVGAALEVGSIVRERLVLVEDLG